MNNKITQLLDNALSSHDRNGKQPNHFHPFYLTEFNSSKVPKCSVMPLLASSIWEMQETPLNYQRIALFHIILKKID